MNGLRYKGECFPTSKQELLLRAALLSGKDTVEAWHEWKSGATNVDQLDPGAYRLLPLLYHNLCAQGVKEPLVEQLKGIYRHTWYKNQLLFHHAAAVLRSFLENGIKPMILDGAAMVLLYHADYGLRPVDDFGVLIHARDAPAGFDILKKLGWMPKLKAPETYMPVARSIEFKDCAGRRIELHWSLLAQRVQGEADSDFWKRGVPITVEDISTSALNPTDQLLQVCVKGVEWSPAPPFVWVADAMAILNRSQPEIDWSRLIAQAERCRLVLPTKNTLSYLRDELEAPIPASALQSIEMLPVSKVQRVEYRARADRPTHLRTPLVLWFSYLRLIDGAPPPKKLAWLPRYIQYKLGVEPLWQMPFLLVLKGLESVREVVF